MKDWQQKDSICQFYLISKPLVSERFNECQEMVFRLRIQCKKVNKGFGTLWKAKHRGTTTEHINRFPALIPSKGKQPEL